MKTLEDWLEAYAVSHQNKTNKLIHYFCVPAIYFSIVGLLMSIPSGVLSKVNVAEPVLVNWAVVVLIPVFIFYARLSLKVAILILFFSAFCVFEQVKQLRQATLTDQLWNVFFQLPPCGAAVICIDDRTQQTTDPTCQS